MDFQSKKFGKCVLADLTQIKAEAYAREMQGKGDVPLTVWRGDSVRVVAKLELLLEPELTPDAIDNASPGLIFWLSECVNKWMAEALEIDPLS